MSKHLKVCNAKIKLDTQPPYVVKNTNLSEITVQFDDIPLSAINQDILNGVLNKIKNSYGNSFCYTIIIIGKIWIIPIFLFLLDKLPKIPEKILQHEVLQDELSNPIYGTEAKRHLLQTASLLGHLAEAELICDNTCYIEFGAGRGKITYVTRFFFFFFNVPNKLLIIILNRKINLLVGPSIEKTIRYLDITYRSFQLQTQKR